MTAARHRDGPPRPPLDVRLAVAAGAGWLGVLATTPLGATASLGLGAGSAVVLVATVVLARRRTSRPSPFRWGRVPGDRLGATG